MSFRRKITQKVNTRKAPKESKCKGEKKTIEHKIKDGDADKLKHALSQMNLHSKKS